MHPLDVAEGGLAAGVKAAEAGQPSCLKMPLVFSGLDRSIVESVAAAVRVG